VKLSRRCFQLLALASLFAGPFMSGGAQAAPRPAGSPRSVAADTAPACCTIVRVDSVHSRVTARELATGFTFMFDVKSRRQLRALKPGRPVWADFSRKTVRLSHAGRDSCCTMLPLP